MYIIRLFHTVVAELGYMSATATPLFDFIKLSCKHALLTPRKVFTYLAWAIWGHQIQSSAVTTRFNITWCCTHNCRKLGRISIKCWTHTRHTLPWRASYEVPPVNILEKIDWRHPTVSVFEVALREKEDVLRYFRETVILLIDIHVYHVCSHQQLRQPVMIRWQWGT